MLYDARQNTPHRLTGTTLALASLLRTPAANMSYHLAILIVSFLASLSLASPVARQTSLSACISDGTTSADNFTLLAVSQVNPDLIVQTPLALGPNGPAGPNSFSYLAVSTLFFGCFTS